MYVELHDLYTFSTNNTPFNHNCHNLVYTIHTLDAHLKRLSVDIHEYYSPCLVLLRDTYTKNGDNKMIPALNLRLELVYQAIELKYINLNKRVYGIINNKRSQCSLLNDE